MKKAYFLCIIILFLSACSFDYSAGASSESSKPDIVMEDIEYVRVRGGDPLVRFKAEYAERWENRQIMELREFTFEQMEDSGDTINADGRAGLAIVQIGSGDVSLKNGVRIRVDSEDVIIKTAELEWKDSPKTLATGDKDEVDIERSDGTSFSGKGFFADARNRIWKFSGEVMGIYVEKDDDEDEEDGEGGTEAQEIVLKDDEPEQPLSLKDEFISPEEQSISPEEKIPDEVLVSPVENVYPESKPFVSPPVEDVYPQPIPYIPYFEEK
ncbi:MAG: LPS export ABC transporter periplasmic protein LptC [Treponema sp.]|nr:LPS export ABC transporter periplasmic protein LptC [Treponema sp.]